MTDNFNINRRKFISTGAALSLGIPLMGKSHCYKHTGFGTCNRN
jgi:uncharacterized protein (DUF1501 family)